MFSTSKNLHDQTIDSAELEITQFLNSRKLLGTKRSIIKTVRLRNLAAFFIIGKHYVISYTEDHIETWNPPTYDMFCCRSVVPRNLSYLRFEEWLKEECVNVKGMVGFGSLDFDEIWSPVEAVTLVMRDLMKFEFGEPIPNAKHMLASSIAETGSPDQPFTQALMACIAEKLLDHTSIAYLMAEIGNDVLGRVPPPREFDTCRIQVNNPHHK